MHHFFPVVQVSSELFRSPQPDLEDLLKLKEQGIIALVNLRQEATESELFARQLGLAYLHLPIIDWHAPSLEQVEQFLDFIQQKEHKPTLVHCAAGVGRTGVMVACYRLARAVPLKQAITLTDSEGPIAEMGMNDIQHDFVASYAKSSEQNPD